MRNKIGVLMVEEASGDVGMQLFENPDAVAGSFNELRGRLGEPNRRATLLKLEYNEDGSVKSVEAVSKNLPVPVVEASDGYVIGEGPRIQQ